MIYSPISSPIRSAVSSLFANRGGFVPSRLFAAGEQGAWYDPSDLGTLFQDAAGTTPVTAVEQPVGLMLDKSKGLVLGPELVANGTFDTNVAGWGPSTSSVCTWDSGRAAIKTIPGAISVATLIASQGMPTTIGNRYAVSVKFDKGTVPGSNSRITVSNNADGSAAFFATTLGVFGSGTLWATFVATASTTYIAPRMESVSEGQTWYVDNISVRELPGNHATQTTSTSRPVLRQDAGGRYYLSFDGVDDFLVTNSIDFTATDKVTVFAGVRKLSDAAAGVIAELSATAAANNGAFYLINGSTGATPGYTGYGFSSRGSSNGNISSPSGFVAPLTNVLAGLGNISGDSAIIRINGVQAGQSATDQGTGNYGNYPLYIGRRGGTTLPFNGQLYSLIVRGAQTSDTQVSQTETWVNQRTGAY